ncbi:MAG: type II toxin-antitoxin system VapB family antitoxin [Aquisalimonadaceae bacterium]
MTQRDLNELLSHATQPPRTAKLFINGRNQAVRLPRELEFKGTDEVSIYQVGTRLVIEPKRRSWLDIANAPAVDDEFMKERPSLLSGEGRVKL